MLAASYLSISRVLFECCCDCEQSTNETVMLGHRLSTGSDHGSRTDKREPQSPGKTRRPKAVSFSALLTYAVYRQYIISGDRWCTHLYLFHSLLKFMVLADGYSHWLQLAAVLSSAHNAASCKGATTSGSRGGPDTPKSGRTTPTFLMKSVITVT